MKRLLITGATGFIGRHCLPLLIARDFEVHAAVRKNTKQPAIPSVSWHTSDLLNLDETRALIQEVRPTHLLHFAWVTQPGIYGSSLENLRWLQGSLELLRTFKGQGGRRVVVAGTCAEYDSRFAYCSEQTTPLNPQSLYGSCKQALYNVLMSYAKQESLAAAWGRLFSLYGPYEHPSRLVPSVTLNLLADRPADCTQGTQIRDFLHVEDVGSAFAAILDDDVVGAVNIASGKPVAVKELIERLAEQIGRPELVHFGALPTPDNEPPMLVGNVRRLQAEVGWLPSISLESGLASTIAWWREQRQAE